MLKVGDLLEGAASAQPAARSGPPANPPAFGLTLSGLLGGEPPPLPAAGKDIEPQPAPEPEHDPDDEDPDARLLALLPGLDLNMRPPDRPGQAPAITPGHLPGKDQLAMPATPNPATSLAAAASATAAPADPAGTGPKPADVRILPAVGLPPTSAAPSPATSARAWPGATILDTGPLGREGPRVAHDLFEPPGQKERASSSRERAATPPATAELQARRQFAAQAATASSSVRLAAADAQQAAAPAQARPEAAPPVASTPAVSELVTRIAGGKADALAQPQRSSATASVDVAPGIGGTSTSAGPATPAAPATPDLAGAEGRAAWQQALARHVGLIVAGETGEARLQIESGKLGPIEVHVKIDGERVDVRFSIQHPITASLVQDALPRLEKMLEQQGFSLGHSSIDQGQSREQGGREAAATSRSASRSTAAEDDLPGGGTAVAPSPRNRAANALLDDFA